MDIDSDESANEICSNRRPKRKNYGKQPNMCESDDGDFSNDDDPSWLPDDSESTEIVDLNQNENHPVSQILVEASTENINDSVAVAEWNDSSTATRERNNFSRNIGK